METAREIRHSFWSPFRGRHATAVDKIIKYGGLLAMRHVCDKLKYDNTLLSKISVGVLLAMTKYRDAGVMSAIEATNLTVAGKVNLVRKYQRRFLGHSIDTDSLIVNGRLDIESIGCVSDYDYRCMSDDIVRVDREAYEFLVSKNVCMSPFLNHLHGDGTMSITNTVLSIHARLPSLDDEAYRHRQDTIDAPTLIAYAQSSITKWLTIERIAARIKSGYEDGDDCGGELAVVVDYTSAIMVWSFNDFIEGLVVARFVNNPMTTMREFTDALSGVATSQTIDAHFESLSNLPNNIFSRLDAVTAKLITERHNYPITASSIMACDCDDHPCWGRCEQRVLEDVGRSIEREVHVSDWCNYDGYDPCAVVRAYTYHYRKAIEQVAAEFMSGLYECTGVPGGYFYHQQLMSMIDTAVADDRPTTPMMTWVDIPVAEIQYASRPRKHRERAYTQ